VGRNTVVANGQQRGLGKESWLLDAKDGGVRARNNNRNGGNGRNDDHDQSWPLVAKDGRTKARSNDRNSRDGEDDDGNSENGESDDDDDEEGGVGLLVTGPSPTS
jgi:hypothetical protein